MIKTFCAFCGKHEDEVETIVASQLPDVHICDICVERAYGFIKEARADQKQVPIDMKSIRKQDVLPAMLKEYLDQYVVNQEVAKKALSVAVYNHYKRLFITQYPQDTDDHEVEIEKSNVFLVGPTGVGKTLLARTIAKKLQVPFSAMSVTQMTQSGYVGDDPESALSALLQAADGNVQAAEMGIVYLDEADKIARKGQSPSLTRDVGGEGVQQALLKMIEGGVINVPPHGGRKHPEQKMIPIDTTNILFIFGGAFEGIERLIEKRLHMRPLGFDLKKPIPHKVDQDLGSYVSAQDLKAFGLIPELVGRIPVITHLSPLDRRALRKVLTDPKNALIKQYKKLLAMEGITLTFTDHALDYIVEKAIELKVGARGLRSICETIMQDAMFTLPAKEDVISYQINAAYAKSKFERSPMASLKAA